MAWNAVTGSNATPACWPTRCARTDGHTAGSRTTIPTIGFNVERVEYKNLTMTIWDIGGQAKLRRLWHHYFECSNGVIFVVDSMDAERVKDVKEELHAAMADERIPRKGRP